MARPRRIKTLNLHIKIIGRLEVPINSIIDATNEIFEQARIVVNLITTEQLDLSRDELEFFEPMDVGACKRKPSDDQIQISEFRANADVNHVVAYFCRTVLGDVTLDGCSTHPRGAPMVVIASGVVNSILAHELGHLLKLTHCGDLLLDRLMNTAVAEIPPPLILTESEIKKMRKSKLLT